MSTSSTATALRPAENRKFYYIEKPYGDITLLEILEHTQVYSNRRMIDRHMLLIVGEMTHDPKGSGLRASSQNAF